MSKKNRKRKKSPVIKTAEKVQPVEKSDAEPEPQKQESKIYSAVLFAILAATLLATVCVVNFVFPEVVKKPAPPLVHQFSVPDSEAQDSEEEISGESGTEESPDEESSEPERVFDRPKDSDFVWMEELLEKPDKLSEKNEPVSDEKLLNGEWKGKFIYYDDEFEPVVRELVNADIQLEKHNASVTLYWYCADYGDGYKDETKNEPLKMEGTFDDTQLRTFSSQGNLEINVFFTKNEKQYAVGFLTLPNGEGAYLGLVKDLSAASE